MVVPRSVAGVVTAVVIGGVVGVCSVAFVFDDVSVNRRQNKTQVIP